MILDSTTKSIQFKLAGAVASNQLPCVASWADMSGSSFTPGSSTSQTNDSTAVTVVAAPGSSIQRQVKSISIYNDDSADAAVSIIYNDNSTLRTLANITLEPSETLQFAENSWSVIDSSGRAQLATSGEGADGGGTPVTSPSVFHVSNYDAKGDGKSVSDGAMTASSATLTCATSAPFTSADVGKVILVNGAGPSVNGSSSGGALSTTISAYISATQVTLATSATYTVSGTYISYGTDDTAAINDTISAASSYAFENHYYAEVMFEPTMYMIAGPLIQGGASKTNSQIPLPVVPIAGNPTMTLKLTGTRCNAGPEMFQAIGGGNKPAPANEGTVLKSTLLGQTYSGTYGQPAVIGGPTVEQGYIGAFTTEWNNLMLVVDGLTVTVPVCPSVTGLDMTSNVKAEVLWFRAMADGPAYQLGAYNPIWNSGESYPKGMVMPQGGNNAHCLIGSYTAYGFATGLMAYEHTTFTEMVTIFCGTGLYVNGQHAGHGVTGLKWSAEANDTHLTLANSGDHNPVNITSVQCENINQFTSGYHINDPNNTGYGRIGFHTSQNVSTIAINGASNMEIILDRPVTRGHQTSPTVPATTVALRNPFWRHAWVIVSGGTVTDIAVGGESTGLTSGAVRVPSGQSISLTYSAAPAWKWWLD